MIALLLAVIAGTLFGIMNNLADINTTLKNLAKSRESLESEIKPQV